jgi:molybdenum cofactor cytidylyltransferase
MNRSTSLTYALGVSPRSIVSLVGGGGKTTALMTLIREARAVGIRALGSTTTMVGRRVETGMPVVFSRSSRWKDVLSETLSREGRAFLASSRRDDGKLMGVSEDELRVARDLAGLTVVEADGARQRPLKVPGSHEPVIPAGVDLVVPVAGLDALGHTAPRDVVHRPELVPDDLLGDVIGADFIAALITSDWGGMKGVPDGARVRPLLNKLDVADLEEARRAAELTAAAGVPEIDRVVLASLLREDYTYIEPPG